MLSIVDGFHFQIGKMLGSLVIDAIIFIPIFAIWILIKLYEEK